MKKIVFITFLLIKFQIFALVSDGKAQEVTIQKEKDKIVFLVNKKKFTNVEDCAKYCYKISSTKKKSEWANLVNIKIIDINLSKEDRQYIGDRFVLNKVYPNKINMTYTYKTDGPLREEKKKN